MRAGDGVSRRAVACNDNGIVRCVGSDRVRSSGVVLTGLAVRGNGCAINLYGIVDLRPKDKFLRDVAGAVNTYDGAGRAAPADGNGFAFTDANRVVVFRCRNAHAKHGYEHRGNQKQGKHFLGCFHDLFSF